MWWQRFDVIIHITTIKFNLLANAYFLCNCRQRGCEALILAPLNPHPELHPCAIESKLYTHPAQAEHSFINQVIRSSKKQITLGCKSAVLEMAIYPIERRPVLKTKTQLRHDWILAKLSNVSVSTFANGWSFGYTQTIDSRMNTAALTNYQQPQAAFRSMASRQCHRSAHFQLNLIRGFLDAYCQTHTGCLQCTGLITLGKDIVHWVCCGWQYQRPLPLITKLFRHALYILRLLKHSPAMAIAFFNRRCLHESQMLATSCKTPPHRALLLKSPRSALLRPAGRITTLQLYAEHF